ncbi:MAG: ATP-dependent Clp protease proteolytic subunit [Lachnospiraceae bacterium]|nr:ATP-dependent Clp protease proteolytic subunit [Lachnospiraceae bacterium]
MHILERKSNGTTLIPIEAKAYEQRTIYVQGIIDEQSAAEFVREIIELNRQNAAEPIKVLITSSGGSVVYGLAEYDAIISSKAPVWTYCIGTAYSMAAILFAAGRKRMILENSKVMLHQPLIGENQGGNASSVKSMSDSLMQTKSQLVGILSKHTGMTKKQIDKQISYDHYYTAKEAVEAHLADEIVGIDSII